MNQSTEEQADANAQSDTTVPDSPDDQPESVFAADAVLLNEPFTRIEPGTYRVDTLGTPFSFVTDENMEVQSNANGIAVFTALHSSGPDDRDMFFLRMSALSAAGDPMGSLDTLDSGWPATDFTNWLGELPAGVVVSGRQDEICIRSRSSKVR